MKITLSLEFACTGADSWEERTKTTHFGVIPIDAIKRLDLDNERVEVGDHGSA